MRRIFDVTASKENVILDKGHGEVAFTVTNTTSQPLRGQLRLKAQGEMQPAWLGLVGEKERNFESKGTEQVTGLVTREAYDGDAVCVTPERRAAAAADNREALSRRQPGGGPYGEDTCKQGYVWREARPEDHVCVLPPTRTLTAQENAAALAKPG